MTFENVEEARWEGQESWLEILMRNKTKNILLQDVFNFDLIQVLPEKQFTWSAEK